MGIDPSPLSCFYDVGPLTDQIERGHGQDQTEALQGAGRSDQGGFQLKAVGCIVEEIFFNIEAQGILSKGLQTGGLIADDQPALGAVQGATDRQMEGAKLGFGDFGILAYLDGKVYNRGNNA